LDQETGRVRQVAAAGSGYSGSTLDKVDEIAAVAEDVLRAEADENTQRKALTPVEAARPRPRRARVLGPLAEARKVAHGGTAPGRPSTASKLDEVSRTEAATRKVAATGTGYSGSTLDKVDEVAAIAEDKTKPEPVREVAREQLAAMDRGTANPTQAQRQVHEHLARSVAAVPGAARPSSRSTYPTGSGRASGDWSPECPATGFRAPASI